MVNNLIKLRVYFILFSKIVGIVLCVYYIYKVQDYKVTWNLFSLWLVPQWLSNINNILNTIGTYILVVPLSIIIVSLLIQNTWLNIVSCLFSISGGIVSILVSIKQGTMLEYTNMKLFVVYHGLALESKRVVFINEYKTGMLSLSKDIENKLEYFNEHLGSQYFIIYDEVLKKLPATEIKTYANSIVKTLLINIEKSTPAEPGLFKRISTVIWEGCTVQNIAISVVIVVGLVISYKLISWLVSNNEPLKTAASIQKDGANISQEGNTLQGDMIQSTKDIIKVLQDLYKNLLPNISKTMVDHGTSINMVKKEQATLLEATTLLHSFIMRLNSVVKEQQAEINKLIAFVKTLKDDE